MITPKQIQEIREHLSKAQNPVFFFDNDPDGLCSFLLLQRYIERGRGVAIKSFPELTSDYFRKVSELNADYVFILDKPVVSKEFLEQFEQVNIPVVWIDHHKGDAEVPKFVHYYNSSLNTKGSSDGEPVTYICYKVSQKKEDLWIAVVGCISDKFIPEFYSDFKKEYPDWVINSKDAFDILYNSQIGKIAKIFSFALKDRTTNVINMIRFLIKVKTPYDILEESSKNYTMHSKFKEIDKKYQKFLKKALEIGKNSDKILFFQYAGELSMSRDLSNELYHTFPEKVIVAIYTKGIKANISVRGEKIREKVLTVIGELEGATGGGHENSVGLRVNIEDLNKFKDRLSELVGK